MTDFFIFHISYLCSSEAVIYCKADNKLLELPGLLTKKFINLIKHAEDGMLDLNKAAETLEVSIQLIIMNSADSFNVLIDGPFSCGLT